METYKKMETYNDRDLEDEYLYSRNLETPEKNKHRFFSKLETFIIEHGLKVLLEKLQELNEKDQLPTHFIFLDTSSRVFVPAVKKLMDAFYTAHNIKIPSITFAVPKRSDETEKSTWSIEDRIEEILVKTKSKVSESHLMIIDDFVAGGVAMKGVIAASENVGVDANFFTFFFPIADANFNKSRWEERKNLEKSLGPNFFYGTTDETPVPSHLRHGSYSPLEAKMQYCFQSGRILKANVRSDRFERRASKSEIIGVTKDRDDPEKYATRTTEGRSKGLVKEIRRESKAIGERFVEKLKEAGKISKLEKRSIKNNIYK